MASTAPPTLQGLLVEAATLLAASEQQVTVQVDELASTLRAQLPGLDHTESLQVAIELFEQYGDDDDASTLAGGWPNIEYIHGPSPAQSGLMEPGKAEWWKKS